ncbi:MAG: hypothetical protein WD767_03750 [Alphaproteobacteria bacterium]
MSKRIRPAAEIRRRNRLESQTANRGDVEKNPKRPRQPPVSLPEGEDFDAGDTLLRQAGYEYTPDPMGRLDRGVWTGRDGRPLTSVARDRILQAGRRANRPDRGRATIPFSDLSPEDREILDDRPGTRRPEEETDVAVAPLAIPAAALLTRFLPPAIAAYRALQLLPPPAGKVPGLPETRDGAPRDALSPRVMTDPLPPTPPFPSDPPEGLDGGRYETPADKVEGSVLVTPIPPGLRPEDTVTIFPDQSDLFVRNFYESRRGSAETQLGEVDLREEIDDAVIELEMGEDIKHWAGAKDSKGNQMPQNYMKPRDRGRVGGSYPDLAYESKKTGRKLYINTVDTRADGSPTIREDGGAVRITINGETGDLLVTVPKAPPGKRIDRKAFRKFIIPILKELNEPKPDVDLREYNAKNKIWYRFDPKKHN